MIGRVGQRTLATRSTSHSRESPAVRVKLSVLEWVACDNEVWRRASTQNVSGMPSCATSLGLRRYGLVTLMTGHLCGTNLAPRWSARSQAAEWS